RIAALKIRSHPCSLLRRRGGCGYGILAVEFIYESLRNIDAVRGIDNWHSSGINNEINVVCFGKSFECFANFLLYRSEQLSLTSCICRLSIFTLALDVFL